MEEQIRTENEVNVWITSDLHWGHKNIIKYEPHRVKDMGMKSENDMTTHNEYLIKMINEKVKRNDRIYFLGDIVFGNRDDAMAFMSRINCKNKYFINGNHDAAFNGLDNLFRWKEDMKEVTFKKNEFSFLDMDFDVFMCHYPMKSWPRKSYGCMNLYGHVHSQAPYIDESEDLCLNVGIDNPFSNCSILNLRQVYTFYKKKLKGYTPRQYIEKITKENKKFTR